MSRLAAKLAEPTDGASLAVWRVCFGAILMLEVVRFWTNGWIEQYYEPGDYHFTYLGFDWVRPWPGWGMHAHFGFLFACALGLALGWRARLCALLFGLGFTQVFLIEKARYLNHFYLVAILAFLMAAVPCGACGSIEAWRRGGPRAIPRWALELLRFQLGLVYFYAGVAKLNPDWLRGEPMRRWLADRADHPGLGWLIQLDGSAWMFSYGGLLLDLCAWPALVWAPTRRIVFPLLCAFHLMNASLFGIGIFPWTAIAATTLFLEPDWPRRALELVRARPRRALGAPAPIARPLAGLLLLHLALQLLVPLRHFLYPGRVSWTEEGHAFAWHMKLRGKDAVARFVLRDPDGGVELVDPLHELPPWKASKMATRPDMVQQYARHLAAQREARGRPRPAVYASVYCSLNGRAPELLIDPAVDLAAEPRNLARADWILPLRGSLWNE